ncbi:hypothetical protein [Flagellimonas abyssi]|uniref:ATP-binding protein n=1 Tax=Flagellimonas abyssi TaxID=2864871 RepID=A0ABS7EVL7_9FLAO|nr:hypothetical protein [Allomuricauda abyssi]MBW8200883.1 hypothetical protein [Allomuricauda abyssi]
MWNNFKTYGDSPEIAFETLCNQLFERFMHRNYKKDLARFRVINGAGGDGGIEAYGELHVGGIVAVQSKWFPTAMQTSQINQIKKSITTALEIRPNISEYIICVPRNFASKKRGKEGKIPKNTEEDRVNKLVSDIKELYNDLKLTWWTTDGILRELQLAANEGIHRYWFDKETIDFSLLTEQFRFQKTNNWLKERYVPALHTRGVIHEQVGQLIFSKKYRVALISRVRDVQTKIQKTAKLLESFSDSVSEKSLLPAIKEVEAYLAKTNVVASDLIREIVASNMNYRVISDCQEPEGISILANYLDDFKPIGIEKNTVYDLKGLVQDLLRIRPMGFFMDIGDLLNVSRKFIFGGPGTGKTQGLANVVELAIDNDYPAILIRAKTANSGNWTSLLEKAMDVRGWNKNELFSALEALAIKKDIQKAMALDYGVETDYSKTVALICIDGLEEAVEKKEEWYDRIAETKEITLRYPRIKFVFTARHYFYDNSKGIDSLSEEVHLEGDGDVQIYEVIGAYFEQYRITGKLSHPIQGLTSLFALRLFCEEYEGQNLDNLGKVETTVQKLLNLKVARLNAEFTKNVGTGMTIIENPVTDGLSILSKAFYESGSITHQELVQLLSQDEAAFFTPETAASLIQFLVNNGVLTKYEQLEKTGILEKKVTNYSITYQSIIEILISEEIYENIKVESEDKLPDILFRPLALPKHQEPIKDFRRKSIAPNRQIIQNLVSRIFNEQEKLIGEEDFLVDGLSQDQVLDLQFEALLRAPESLAVKYDSFVRGLFFKNYEIRFKVIKKLIIPSSKGNGKFFNANWLHEILMGQSTVFERDKLWSDLDNEEMNDFSESERYLYRANYTLRKLLTDNILDRARVSDDATHEGFPLILAWGLSTIDRELREGISSALTQWGILNPREYKLLLTKIFNCNDPQVQEDLASITLGIASRLKDFDGLQELSGWALSTIFEHRSVHRNVIVRQGFRSIVERAFRFGLISEEKVALARPRPMEDFRLLKLDTDYFRKAQREYYPIVHDLAWYVIEKGYQNFLTGHEAKNEAENKSIRLEHQFLDQYRKNYGNKEIYPRSWTMSAALHYIKGLGLTRTKGSWFTDASHGSKSKIYTYEEKYTWLAVHYLQGYLSDYLPYAERSYSVERDWIANYNLLTPIHNPVENVMDEETINHQLEKRNSIWRIKESLVKEIVPSDSFREDIEKAVLKDPDLDFKKWLFFKDFEFLNKNELAVSLYGWTELNNRSETLITSLKTQACIIEKRNFEVLKDIVINQPGGRYWLGGSDNYQASADTYVYANPTDIVWMDWIGESQNEIWITDEISFFFTRTSVTKNDTQGEKEVFIPAKKVRALLGISDYKDDKFLDTTNTVVGSISEVSEGSFKDRQELLVVKWDMLRKALEAKGLQILWFSQFFSRQNPFNEKLDKDFYAQRVKKYFIWQENKEFKSHKFWDERFSNHKD